MMHRETHWSTVVRHLRGDAASRGATLVEYALVFALVMVTALGAAQFLQDESQNEIDNQAECVSMRPPPPGCLLTAITTTTTLVPPSIPVTTVPPPAPSAPIVRPAGAARASTDPAPRWIELDVSVMVEQPPDFGGGEAPVAGAIVRGEVRLVDPLDPAVYLPDTFFVNCTTGAGGQCTLRFDVPYVDVTRALLEVTGVDADVEPTFPAPIIVDKQWP